MRAVWLAMVVGLAAIGSAFWALTNPGQISAVQSGSIAGLLLGLAIISGHALRPDMSAVLPVVTVAAFSIPRLVPFDLNLIYNPASLPALVAVTAVTAVAAAAGALRGHRDERYE